jgi:hypothetical protein
VDLTVSQTPYPILLPFIPLRLLLPFRFLGEGGSCQGEGKNRDFEVAIGDSGRLTSCYSLLALWDCSSLDLGLNSELVFGLGSELELTCRTFGLDMGHGNSKPDLIGTRTRTLYRTRSLIRSQPSKSYHELGDAFGLACRLTIRTSNLDLKF